VELLPLCLGGNRHATSEDHVDLRHMLIAIRIISMILTLTGILRCRHYWWWHLLMIQKSLTLFQIMSCGVMDLTPIFCIIEMPEECLLLLRGLFVMISAVSSVIVISSIVLLP
jgi:hypothetical protein